MTTSASTAATSTAATSASATFIMQPKDGLEVTAERHPVAIEGMQVRRPAPGQIEIEIGHYSIAIELSELGKP